MIASGAFDTLTNCRVYVTKILLIAQICDTAKATGNNDDPRCPTLERQQEILMTQSAQLNSVH